MAINLFHQLYPAAQTRIILVGLLVDKLTSSPKYTTADSDTVFFAGSMGKPFRISERFWFGRIGMLASFPD
jgi:hypothetical protein